MLGLDGHRALEAMTVGRSTRQHAAAYNIIRSRGRCDLLLLKLLLQLQLAPRKKTVRTFLFILAVDWVLVVTFVKRLASHYCLFSVEMSVTSEYTPCLNKKGAVKLWCELCRILTDLYKKFFQHCKENKLPTKLYNISHYILNMLLHLPREMHDTKM